MAGWSVKVDGPTVQKCGLMIRAYENRWFLIIRPAITTLLAERGTLGVGGRLTRL